MSYRNPVTKPLHNDVWQRPAGNLDFRIVRLFGDMSEPQYGPHNGIDLGDSRCGSVVVAAERGSVDYAAADPKSGGANIVIIRHPNGERTWYAHLASIAVKVGASVNAGAPLGTVGDTGWAIGCHLHFQRQVRNSSGAWQDVDPLPILTIVEPPLPDTGTGEEMDLAPYVVKAFSPPTPHELQGGHAHRLQAGRHAEGRTTRRRQRRAHLLHRRHPLGRGRHPRRLRLRRGRHLGGGMYMPLWEGESWSVPTG